MSNVWSGMSDRERGVLARRSGHPEELKHFMFNTNEHVLCLGKKWPVFWLRDKKDQFGLYKSKVFSYSFKSRACVLESLDSLSTCLSGP